MVLLCAVMLQTREWPLMTSAGKGFGGFVKSGLSVASPRIAQVDR